MVNVYLLRWPSKNILRAARRDSCPPLFWPLNSDVLLPLASRQGRVFEGGAVFPMPLTPPGAPKSLSLEEKREITQTDHFQVYET